MRDINKPHSLSYTQLLNPDFLNNINNQLFQFMNILIKVQKENMDQLNSVSVGKTQKLIGKIQKDPGVMRRLQQLEVMHKTVNNPVAESFPSPINKENELIGKRAFSSSDDTVFKKRKLNDEETSKDHSRSEMKSDQCSEMDECIDFEKVPEICSPLESVSENVQENAGHCEDKDSKEAQEEKEDHVETI